MAQITTYQPNQHSPLANKFKHGNLKCCLGSTDKEARVQGLPRPWWGAGATPCRGIKGGKVLRLKMNSAILETHFWPLGEQKFIKIQNFLKYQNQHFHYFLYHSQTLQCILLTITHNHVVSCNHNRAKVTDFTILHFTVNL